MKSKIKSPDFVSSLKLAAYKLRLKAELALLASKPEPQRFLLDLAHNIGGESSILMVIGYGTDWKIFRKENKMSTNFAAGHCEIDSSGKLCLSIERGKARDRAITSAFRKHSVLKQYELQLELNEADTDEEEINEMESEMAKVKPKDSNSSQVFAQIKIALDEFKAVAAHDFKVRETAMNKVEGLLKIWRASHPNPTSTEDKAIAAQLLKIDDWLSKHRQATTTEKDHADGYKLIDRFVKYRDLLKNAFPEHYQDLLLKFQTLQIDINTWLPLHKEAAKTDKIVNKQYGHLNTAAARITEAINFLQKKIQTPTQKTALQTADKTKNVVPSATQFLVKASLKVGENAELDAIIKRMEQLEDNFDDGPSLNERMRDMIENGVSNFDEFKEIFDARTDQLYSLRNEINAFLKKNKGLFSQITAAQKKRMNAIQTLLANTELELANSTRLLVTVKAKLKTVKDMVADPDTSNIMEALALTSGESSIEAFNTVKIIANNDYKTLGSGLDKFKKMLADGVINVPGGEDAALLKEYNTLGNKPTQQQLDLLFQKGTKADALIQKIANTAETDISGNVLIGDNTQISGVLNDSEELKNLTKMYNTIPKTTFDTVEEMDKEFKKIDSVYQQQKLKLEKIPKEHPQYENTKYTVDAFYRLMRVCEPMHRKYVDAKNSAEQTEKALSKISTADFLKLVIDDPKHFFAKSFEAFAKSEFSFENIEALRNFKGSMQAKAYVKQYLVEDGLNIDKDIINMVIKNANQIDNPTTPYTEDTYDLISPATMQKALREDKAVFEALQQQVIVNISDTYSRYSSKSAETLFSNIIRYGN